MLVLYRFPGATCASKVLMVLAEKSLPFEDRIIERSDLSSEWYRKLNPNGVVPTIVHDGETIIESSVILNYIEDAFAGPQLRPASTVYRARMNHWMKLADDALNAVGTLTYAIAGRQQLMSQPAEAREAYYQSIPDHQVRVSRRSAIELGLDAPEVAPAVQLLVALQCRANKAVRQGGFLADDFSLADISLAPIFFRLSHLGLQPSAAELPDFHRWWSEISARPSFQVGVVSSTPAQALAGVQAAVAAQRDRLAALLEMCSAERSSGQEKSDDP
jgi:glutathione S-transferase